MEIRGKVAVITGASRGIGKATALSLAERGAAVVLNYSRSREEAEAVAGEVRSLGAKGLCVQGDVAEERTCRELMQAAVAEFGRLDILVNNAGTTEFIPHAELDRVGAEHWERIFAVNLRGPFQCARAASPYMERAGEGEIVNVASTAGINARGSSIPYCCSKAGLINLTLSLARVLAPKIRVNAVAPGFIEGEWLIRGLGEEYKASRELYASRTALQKVSRPADIASVIVGLISGSDAVTGQTIVCDAGFLVGRP